MRLLGLAAAAIVFVGPGALLAQHSAPSTPIAPPIAAHISPAPSAVVHSFNTSSPGNPNTTAHTGAPRLYSGATTNPKSGTQRGSDHILSTSTANSQAAKPGFFAFLHRKRPDKHKNASSTSTPSTRVIRHAPAPFISETNVGCRVVA